MADFDDDDFFEEMDHFDSGHQIIDQAPAIEEQLGPWTVMALVLNRTIGSGIFVAPVRVLEGTGSVGVSLLLWAFGALVSTAGLLIWLELGLSVPFRNVKVTPGPNGRFERRPVPRNGGEKNYLAFLYPMAPQFLVDCMYGIPFIMIGNLSANALAIGIFIMHALERDPDSSKAAVIGIAISALTASVLLHMFSRRGGILMNNIFAALKILLLLAIIIVGFLKAGGYSLGGAPKATNNFRLDTSFRGAKHDFVSYTDSLQLIVYTYSGFLQPFYVLAEVAKPRKTFPKYTLIAMALTAVLFMLVNIAYFCAVPRDLEGIAMAEDMASVFFGQAFGDAKAKRVMNAFTAFSIFGNIIVMTFTAARVKQEIAKEGILPFSKFFAKGTTTPWAKLRQRYFNAKSRSSPARTAQPSEDEEIPLLEKSPMAALALHWSASIILIALTSMLSPSHAYFVLLGIYIFAVRMLVGVTVSGGLLLLKATPSRNWKADANISFPLARMHVVLFFTTDLFLLIAAFVKPAEGSPWSLTNAHIQWFIVPTVGISTLTWGLVWYFGLQLKMKWSMRTLVVTRRVLAVPDPGVPGQWIQKGEIITYEWQIKIPEFSSASSLNDHELRNR